MPTPSLYFPSSVLDKYPTMLSLVGVLAPIDHALGCLVTDNKIIIITKDSIPVTLECTFGIPVSYLLYNWVGVSGIVGDWVPCSGNGDPRRYKIKLSHKKVVREEPLVDETQLQLSFSCP